MKRFLFIKTIILASIVLLVVAVPGVAQKIQLNPIKPTAKNQVMSDEQQGVLAVRTIKPSVVDILGFSSSTVFRLGGNAPLIQSQPSGVKGTGFIISADGLIVTNNHVVEDVNFQYTVMFADGSKHPAKVLGLDKYDDVALLKIEAQNLTPATLGDSDVLETGQSVFAIGNTLGRYQNNVTKGVVSGLGRSVDSDSASQPRMQRLIQTDAAISPGNSGGPLINLAGEVVGMNTLIDTEGQSLSFAIPINVIKDVVKQLQTFGKASRPFLGVKFTTLSQWVAVAGKSGLEDGAYISEVVPNSPADKAGIKVGDVIVAVNGKKLNQFNQLDNIVAQFPAGSQVLITYSRNGQTVDATIILAEYQ